MDTSWRALSLINSGIRDCHEQLTVYNMFFKLTEVLCLSRLPRWQTTCLACLIQSPFECAQKRRTTSYPLPDISFLVYRNLSVWLFCLFLVLLTQKPCSFKSYRDGFIYSYIFIYLNHIFENDNVLTQFTWTLILLKSGLLMASKTFLCYTKTEFILSVSMLSWEWVAMYVSSCSVTSDSLRPRGL